MNLIYCRKSNPTCLLSHVPIASFRAMSSYGNYWLINLSVYLILIDKIPYKNPEKRHYLHIPDMYNTVNYLHISNTMVAQYN